MNRGFTLFEMLLVAGLLAIIAALVVPNITTARERALSVQCKSNLHQLATACLEYSMREGYLPWGSISPQDHDGNYWRSGKYESIIPRENPVLHGAREWRDFSSFCWDFIRKRGETGWRCGEMFGGMRADTLFSCPKCFLESDNWDGNHITGYNYNVCYLGYVENDAGKRNYPTAWREIKNPASVVVFGDGGYSGGPNKFMRAPFQDRQYDGSSASLRKAGTQAFRHGWRHWRHCNMAFLDGHVEEFRQPYKAGGSKGWVHEKSRTAFISSGNGIYGPRGFGIADDYTE